jgi:hypothetical protein
LASRAVLNSTEFVREVDTVRVLPEIVHEVVRWITVAEDKNQLQALVNTIIERRLS